MKSFYRSFFALSILGPGQASKYRKHTTHYLFSKGQPQGISFATKGPMGKITGKCIAICSKHF
jgi:hypothetical protein